MWLKFNLGKFWILEIKKKKMMSWLDLLIIGVKKNLVFIEIVY